ncbi:MAG: LD-carboxypeptidase [Pseudomonadota bacterium]
MIISNVNSYKNWDVLQLGDIVDIIAPACGCDEIEITKSIEFIKSLGLVPRVQDNICDPSAMALCANSDEFRFNDLKRALYAKDSKAIWCLRGGYGCCRIVNDLYKIRAPRNSKLFIGFSDITTLLIFLNQRWRWSVIHGPVLFQIINQSIDQISIDAIKNVIFGQTDKMIYDNIMPLNDAARINKSVYSHILGGNLCLLQNSIGTNWQLKSKNNIIFIEEVGERAYRIERMLIHMLHAGLFTHANAIIFGDIVGGVEKDSTSLHEMVLNKFAATLDIPVLQMKNVGHGYTNYPLPMGTNAILRLNNKSATLQCNVGFVK